MKAVRLALPALLATALAAEAFVSDLNGSGNVRRWSLLTSNPNVSTNVVNPNTHAIRFFLALDGFSTTNTVAELNAVRASFDQWQAISNTYLKFEEAGLTTPPPNLNAPDGKNTVYWAKTNTMVGTNADISGVLGYTVYWTIANNTMLEADIVFNGVEYDWFTEFTNTTSTSVFVEAVAAHEIGHLIGLKHSPLGGATMLWAGSRGVNIQAGLSSDDIASARFLYPATSSNYGSIKGTVTRSGSPVFGAAVYVQDAVTNTIQGTVTRSDGTYLVSALPPGDYLVRVAPLDPAGAARFLRRGWEIDYTFGSAETAFLPSAAVNVAVTANATNTASFSVDASDPPYRITDIRRPTTNPGSYSWSGNPTSLRVGQSNYLIGVASTNLPTSGATLSITGDGLTLGTTAFNTIQVGDIIYHFISVPISVSSNATPGIRSFVLTEGANVVYADGFLDIQPAVADYNFDGLDDLFQRYYFPVFTSPDAAPNANPDGDHFNNYAECISGSDPTNAASYLRITSVTTAGNGTTVHWPSANGKHYQVSSRPTWVGGAWQNIGSPVTATGATAQYLDPTATNGMRFYRVQALP